VNNSSRVNNQRVTTIAKPLKHENGSTNSRYSRILTRSAQHYVCSPWFSCNCHASMRIIHGTSNNSVVILGCQHFKSYHLRKSESQQPCKQVYIDSRINTIAKIQLQSNWLNKLVRLHIIEKTARIKHLPRVSSPHIESLRWTLNGCHLSGRHTPPLHS